MEKIEWKNLIDGAPFSERVKQTWANFSENASEIERLIDENAALGDVVRLVSQSLSPAFDSVTFRIGKENGESKYSLYLSPDGLKPLVFEQIYFKKNAPQEILERWNVRIGLPPDRSDSIQLEEGLDPRDLQYKVHIHENDRRMKFDIYCPMIDKLDEETVWTTIAKNLHILLGEVHYAKFIEGFELVREQIPAEDLFTYEEVLHLLKLSAGGDEVWDEPSSLEDVVMQMREYNRIKQEKLPGDEIVLRETATGALTCMPAFEASYLSRNTFLMNFFKSKGIVPGFLVVELTDNVTYEEMMENMSSITPGTETDSYLQIGLGKGERFYLDYIVWDIETFLTTIKERVKKLYPLKTVYFRPFNVELETIRLK